ncbi:Radical_SAM C-terminal domain-containing protein [Thermosipho atlanticus DSM 15807]|uniref:Radical_SAM C-terminal domain-containing protein n=1 Tax=Thermosipho atlanticus DSM 15807 TaxID=1123380 RepID=A0A1M5QUZ0_9BACT|nr:Radical_SAM C-terminal domain-containing protein [Thermosipho atlanticus DSM 15807]
MLTIFLPNAGCKYRCKFCNQYSMTGEKMPSLNYLKDYFNRFNNQSPKEIAFYGGTFTGLKLETQLTYLKLVQSFFPNTPIRISTRPDEINDENLKILKQYNVKIVELGIQSMYNDVLKASGRGHSVEDNVNAIKKLLENNFIVSAHLMVGLPKDSFSKDLNSFKELIELNVKLFRIHPTIVFKNTLLENEYYSGTYVPLDINEALDICSEQILISFAYNVKIIRLGYFVPEEQKKQIIAGPYHPSFGDIAKAKAIKKIIQRLKIKNVYFPKKYESWFYAYGNKNLDIKRNIWDGNLKFEEFSLQEASKLALKERKKKCGTIKNNQ